MKRYSIANRDVPALLVSQSGERRLRQSLTVRMRTAICLPMMNYETILIAASIAALVVVAFAAGHYIR